MSAFNNMRIDRWIRNNLGKFPQSLIEKNLRNGKIKLNSKKVKSSHKVKTNDQIELFNFEFKKTIIQRKIKFEPNDQIIKENEELIIDNNDDFIVLNKSAGVSVQGARAGEGAVCAPPRSIDACGAHRGWFQRLRHPTGGAARVCRGISSATALGERAELRPRLWHAAASQFISHVDRPHAFRPAIVQCEGG